MIRLPEEMQESKSELRITPMIDVVFLILIFFLCATQLKVPEGLLCSHLPRDRGSSSGLVVPVLPCRITLANEKGLIVLHADEQRIANDSWEELERTRGFAGPNIQKLAEHLSERKMNYTGQDANGLPVIIDFAKNVPWKYVTQALNICRRLNIADVSFAVPELPYE